MVPVAVAPASEVATAGWRAVVVVVPVEVVVGAAVAAVGPAPGSPTLIEAEVPEMPEELSVTRSVVVSAATRVTLTVAKPSANMTLLPLAHSPWAG